MEKNIKLYLPDNLITKIGKEYFLNINNNKTLSYYYDYFNIEIDKIIDKNNFNKDTHFLHTGSKLLFNKDIRTQTWFESLEGYKCWLPNYIIHKYFNASYYHILFNKKMINLNKLPKIINYINIVELKDFHKVEKKTLRTYFSERYTNNNIKKHNVIKRTRFLGKFTSCGMYSLNNKPDAIIVSSSRIKKSKPKTKILIEVINKYSNDDVINGIKLSDEYLKYCNYVSKLNFKGLTKFKKISESYYKNISNLEIPSKFPSNKNNFINYHRILMSELIKHIVDKKYKKLSYIPKIHYINGVPRPNHGVVNIMRQCLFSIKVIEIFKKRNRKLFNNVFEDKHMLFGIIIASHFIAILRIGEGIKGLTESNYITIDSEILKTIFPNIEHTIFNGLVYSNQQVYSGIFLKSILNMYNVDEKTIDIIASTIFYHLDVSNFKKLGIEDYKFKKINKQSIYIILFSIVTFGHYSDHCRGPWSNILEEPFIKLLLNTINATYEDRIEIFEYIQKNIIKTQIKTKLIKGEKCIKKTKNNNNISTKKCCDIIVKNGRYSNKKFKLYSKNFTKLYNVLNFKNELNNIL